VCRKHSPPKSWEKLQQPSAPFFKWYDPDDYSMQSDACSGQTIPAGGNCQVTLVFKPLHLGSRTANLNVPNNDGASPLVVKLSGTGQ
jgi:hypothetical protein